MAISNAFWTIAMPEHGANPAFYNDDREMMRYLVEHKANVKNVPIIGNYPTLLYATVERAQESFALPGFSPAGHSK